MGSDGKDKYVQIHAIANGYTSSRKFDSNIDHSNRCYINAKGDVYTAYSDKPWFTSRPTNTSVMYCIKY